ncbi:hypothetical protein A2U01_0096683, partial [Trifolium medium]|nr:hypothetical protein [Trifolium medium]
SEVSNSSGGRKGTIRGLKRVYGVACRDVLKYQGQWRQAIFREYGEVDSGGRREVV